MKHVIYFIFTALILSPPLLSAEKASKNRFRPETGSLAETDKNLVWEFTPDPSLPNVLILGDSISVGYTLPLRQDLKNIANVYRPMAENGQPDNCGGTTKGVEKIDNWLAGRKWAVIHFNWGLHDLKHVKKPGTSMNSNNPEDPAQASVEEYIRNLEILVGKLKATGARLIFATTTPVASGTINPLREPDAVKRYNEAALKIMRENNIPINDLYSFCEPRLKQLQIPNNVHFTPAGSKDLSDKVSAAVKQALSSQ